MRQSERCLRVSDFLSILSINNKRLKEQQHGELEEKHFPGETYGPPRTDRTCGGSAVAEDDELYQAAGSKAGQISAMKDGGGRGV